MLTVLNRGYKDHKGRSIVGGMRISNSGDSGTYWLDYEVYFGASLSFNLSLSITQGSTTWTLNGANWADLGVSAGDSLVLAGASDIQGNTYSVTVTVSIVNGNEIVVSAAGADSTMYITGELKVVKAPEAVKTKLNLIPKDQPIGVNSLIDGTVPTMVNNNIGSMSVNDVKTLDIIGDLSGHGITSATIERLSDTRGGDAKSYRIEVKFVSWLYLSNYSDVFFSDLTDSVYVETSFLPLWNNPAVALSTGFKPINDGNSGFRNENFNQNTNNFALKSILFTDGTNQISGIDYAKPTHFTIEVENINSLGFATELGLILFNDIEDEDEYRATSLNNKGDYSHLQHTIFTEASNIPTNGSTYTFSGYIGEGGEQLDIELTITKVGQVVTYEGVITPNAEFITKFTDENVTDRTFALLPRLESETIPATNYSDTVNLLAWRGEVFNYPPILGSYFDCYQMNDHADNRICGTCVEPEFSPFIMEVNSGESGTFTIPTNTSTYTYDYDVVTSDGQAFTNQTGNLTITFPENDTNYTIEISGEFPHIYINSNSEKDKFLDISQWGDIEWRDFNRSFFGCENLIVTATDAPDLSSVTNMSYMFHSCTSLTTLDVSLWDVSGVNNMSYMFVRTTLFNQDLSSWDVSSVLNMSGMFSQATSFNQDLSSWNVSSVNNMSYMFYDASLFNKDLSSWDVSNVTDMSSMFSRASLFNQDINSWDVSSVTNMFRMFEYTESFNKDINSWNVSSVNNMSYMFYDASLFNKDLSSWDVSGVTNMSNMFYQASLFNQDLSSWDVSSVTNMSNMFRDATSFNQDLSGWCVSLFPSTPSLFDFGATSWVLPKPIWGTCP